MFPTLLRVLLLQLLPRKYFRFLLRQYHSAKRHSQQKSQDGKKQKHRKEMTNADETKRSEHDNIWGRIFGFHQDKKPTYKGGLKVIGAGWGRTGTSSLQAALEILLGGTCYHMKEVITHDLCDFWIKAAEGTLTLDEYRDHFDHYSSTTDHPACMKWDKLLEAFPQAKVVLSVRNADSWYDSCRATIFNLSPTPFQPWGVKIFTTLFPKFRGMHRMITAIWDRPCIKGDWSRENVIKEFHAFNEDVKKRCPKNQLLVFDVKEGWVPLCKFLDLPVPDTPFPHVNDTNSMKKIINVLDGIGYSIVAVAGIAVAYGTAQLIKHIQ